MTNEDIFDIAGLLQTQWSRCCETINRVNGEEDDGSVDWPEFHEERKIRASQEERYWRGIKDRFVAEHREALKKAYDF